MMRRSALAILLVSCANEPMAAKPTPPVESYGAPLSGAPALDVKTLIAAPQEHDGKTVKIRGRVAKVCQKKGCWMTLATGNPGATQVRVTFEGYAFFVPKDLSGSDVLAEGQFRVHTIPREQAQHYADDEAAAGQPARDVKGDEVELSLVASGVEVLRRQ